jgi:diguanylate cyclase
LEPHILEAHSDGLTGIGNRRAVDLELSRHLAIWQRYGTQFSVILFDIDRFKNVNDEHGHAAGDAVLRAMARVIRDNLRDVDFAARYGGEEFAVILPDTDHHGALTAGDRIRKAVAAVQVPWHDKQLSITVSVGIAGLSLRDDAAALMRRADEALYISKRAGRNRTTLASHTPQADEIPAAVTH